MKKGFTLIELLAVIVILAIVALISSPVIVSLINNSKKESVTRSAEYTARAAQTAYLDSQSELPSATVLTPIVPGGNEYDISQLDLENPPSAGTFIVNQDTYDVTIDSAVFDDYTCSGTVADMDCTKN